MSKNLGQTLIEFLILFTFLSIAMAGIFRIGVHQWTWFHCKRQLFEDIHREKLAQYRVKGKQNHYLSITRGHQCGDSPWFSLSIPAIE